MIDDSVEILISVIIPVYNEERYLEELIFSLMDQSFGQIEFLFIDDGSTDNSYEIINKYSKIDKRIRVISKENAGVSAARNAGLDVARGKYIGFVDSDDTIHPDMYSVLYNTACEFQGDIVSCAYYLDAGNSKKPILSDYRGILEQKSAIVDVLDNKLLGMSVCNKIFKADVLDNCRFSSKYAFNEDRLFLFQAVTNSNKIIIIDDILYNYRVNLDSTSHSSFTCKKMDGIFVAKEIECIVKDKYPEYSDLAYSSVVRVLLFTLEMIYKDKAMEIGRASCRERV